MKKFNKVTRKDGSIGIPAAARRQLGLNPKDPVALEINDKGEVLIKPFVQHCTFCGKECTATFEGSPICKTCAKKIGGLYAKRTK